MQGDTGFIKKAAQVGRQAETHTQTHTNTRMCTNACMHAKICTELNSDKVNTQ